MEGGARSSRSGRVVTSIRSGSFQAHPVEDLPGHLGAEELLDIHPSELHLQLGGLDVAQVLVELDVPLVLASV